MDCALNRCMHGFGRACALCMAKVMSNRFVRRFIRTRAALVWFGLVATTLGLPIAAHAGDIAAGKTLHTEKCVACHVQKSPFGDGDAIYRRADSTVKTYQRLKTMVSLCNSELRLELFPEDEDNLVAFLNAQYYRLPK